MSHVNSNTAHILAALVLAGALFTALTARADDLFVTADATAPMGDGSVASPYNSIASALAAAVPGDVVLLMPGVYDGPVRFPTGGTSGNPITLRSMDEPRTAVIDCLGANVNCVEINHGHIVVGGLEVRNAGYNGIKVDGHVNGTPDESSYGCWGGYCASEGHYNTNGADNVTIRDNYVHDIGYDGIKAGHANNLVIENNEIYDTGRGSTQQGIDLVGVYHSVIRGNYIHDVAVDPRMLVGIFAKGGSEDILIENNYVANILPPFAAIEIGGDTEWYNTRYTPADIGFDINSDILSNDYSSNLINCTGAYAGASCRYSGSTMAEARNVTVRGNIVVNSTPSLSYRNAFSVETYNNTVINSGWSQGWVKLWSDGNHNHPNGDLRFYNNVFYNASDVPLARGVILDRHQGTTAAPNTDGFVFENNLLFLGDGTTPTMGIPAEYTSISDQIVADPMLVSEYQLQASSPAVDSGADLVALGILLAGDAFIDRSGTSRPAGDGYDIGAFEYTDGLPDLDAGVASDGGGSVDGGTGGTDGGTAGTDGSSGTDGGTSVDAGLVGPDPGCSCRTVGRQGELPSALWGLVLVAFAGSRLRRRS